MINWQFFPKSDAIPSHLKDVVCVFEADEDKISSDDNTYSSDEVLGFLRSGLEEAGYQVEKSKKKIDKIHIPVLFGRNGKLERSFEADAFSSEYKTVIEVEAGRAVSNYQFLKDLFQACMMHEVDYLVIGVRNLYSNNKDFEKVISFFDTLYASNRLTLPLKGVLIIGY